MLVPEVRYLPSIDSSTIGEQLSSWKFRYAEMGVMAFLPENERGAVEDLQRLCRKLDIPLVGAVFPAIISGHGFTSQGILLFCLPEMPFTILQDGFQAEDTPDAACNLLIGQIGRYLEDKPEQSFSLFLIFDAMLPHIGRILENLYLELADRVQYMGVNAGSETFQPMPCLFNNERIIENGALALLLPNHSGAYLEHGYKAPQQLVAATSTEGNRIIHIDWRPAFEVYAERIQAQYNVTINEDNFYQYAVHFPFGIIRADGEILVRIPVALLDDGSLFCVGEIPANSILTLLEAPTAESTHTTELLSGHLQRTDDSRPLMLFYCAGRRLHLGVDSAQTEIVQLHERLGKSPLFGALSLGEIGSSQRGGYPLFHNAALVLAGI